MTAHSELIPLSRKKSHIQLVVSMLIILVVSVTGLLLTLLSSWFFFGIAPGEAAIEPGSLPLKQIYYFKYLQAFQHLSIFLIPSVIIAYFMNRDILSYLQAGNKPGLSAASLSVLFIIFLMPLTSYLAWLNESLHLPGWLEGIEMWMKEKELQAEKLTGILLTATTLGGLLVNIFVIAILPALGEEFLFRAILQRIFTGWLRSGSLAVVLTAVLFSASHLQFYGFLPRFVLGLAFGYMYLWSGNIWLPVLAHLINNLIPVILSFFTGWEKINDRVAEFSAQDGIFAIIPALIAVHILYNIRKISTKKN